MWQKIRRLFIVQLKKYTQKTQGTLVIRASWFHRLIYFSPLIGFVLAYPGMQIRANSLEWQIYLFALTLIIIFAFNAGTRPIVRIADLNLSFYHAISGRLSFCYIEDIRYVEARRVYIMIHLRDGESLASPYLRRADISKTLQELERRHIFISYANNKKL